MGYLIVLTFSWFDSLISKSKGILLTACAFAWMAYLGGDASPTTTLDYASYEYYYNLLVTGLPGNRMEWCYTLLSNVAINYNLDYATFRILLVSATFLVLFFTVLRLTKKPVLFASIFMLFPFFNEVTQVRSFVAYTIVLLGISFMRYKVSFKGILFFELSVLLAMGFHSSAGIFLFLPIISMVIQKRGIAKIFKEVTIFSILFACFLMIMSVGNVFVNLIGSVLNVVAGPQVSSTFVNLMSHSDGSTVLFVTVFFSYVGLTSILYLCVDNNHCLTYLKDDPMFKICFSLLLFIELLVPMLLISRDLVRFPRFGFEVCFLVIGTILFALEKNNQTKTWFLIFSILCISVGGWEIYYVYGPPFWDSIPYIAHLINES